MTRRTLAGAACILLAGTLAGCGGPSPTKLTMTVAASAQLNPNTSNQPSPTVVTIYDLKSASAFSGASFDALFYQGRTSLGSDLLAEKNLTMLPGQTLKLDEKAAPGTLFVGVVAGFRSTEGRAWQGILAVKPERRNKIVITLAPTSITIAKAPSGGWF